MNTSPDPRYQHIQAMLTLTTQPRQMQGSCPDDMQLAAFIDGRLQGHERDNLISHMQNCDECYQVWQLSSEAVLNAPAGLERTFQFKQFWQRWLNPLILLPTSGLAVASLIAVMWLPGQQIEETGFQQQLATDYQVLQQQADEVHRVLAEAHFPWFESSNAQGFSALAEKTEAAKTITLGLHDAVQQLKATEQLQTISAKSTHESLGHWLMLLWTASQLPEPLPAEFWQQQQARLQTLQNQLATELDLSTDLKTLSPLFEQLSTSDDPVLTENLGRQVYQLMTQYAG